VGIHLGKCMAGRTHTGANTAWVGL
jgi:hypothetical protein